ncbi:MAG: MFS transporter [Alphaproteobacteria bacterium]
MKKLLAQVWLLLLSISILMVSRGLGSAFIGVRAELEDFSISWIGLIQGATYIGFLISSWYVPRILKNVGHIRVFATCASITSIAPLFQLMFISPYAWVVMQIIFGIGIAGSYIVIEGWLNEASDNENRGKIFGLYSLLGTAVSSAAPLLIGPISAEGIILFLIISITSSIAFVPVALGAKWTPTYDDIEPMKFSTLYKRTPFGVTSFNLSLVVSNTLFMMFIVYAIKAGFEVSLGTKSFLFMGILSIFTTYTLGAISDKMDRRYVIIFTSLMSSIFVYLMFIGANNFDETLFFIGGVGLGGFSYALYPLIVSHINDRLNKTEIVSASSWIVLLSSVTGIIGTISIGPIIEVFGINSFPYLMMAFLLTNCVYGIYRLFKREAVQTEEQVDFVGVTSLGTSVMEQEIFATQEIVKKAKKKKKNKNKKKKKLKAAKKRSVKKR